MRNDKYNQKIDRRKRKLRSLLNLDERVLVCLKDLKRKMHQEIYIKLLRTIFLFLTEIAFLLYIKELN